jgi:hypothetical protein
MTRNRGSLRTTNETTLAYWPIADRATVCGLPEPSSAIVRVPTNIPAKVGEKRTDTEQWAPAAKLVPHWFVTRKKLGEALMLLK